MSDNLITNDGRLLTQANIQNASALLALLHGKCDSICKLYRKEIIITPLSIVSLNDSINEKLDLHNVSTITANIDITLSDKRTLSFKSWADYELCNFENINSHITSLYIQWDFFVKLSNYEIDQKHSISLRISSSPKPSDFFRALLNGGLDDKNDIDVQTCTMMCKVDFINNTLANELINVVDRWYELCETAIDKISRFKRFLYRISYLVADLSKLLTMISISFICAIITKHIFNNIITSVPYIIFIYLSFFIIPLHYFSNKLGNFIARNILTKLDNIMQVHIFNITTGDKKQIEYVDKKNSIKKEVIIFIINTLITVILSIIFFFIE